MDRGRGRNRYYNKNNPHRRQNINSDLNPSANDFVPNARYSEPGPSQSRGNYRHYEPSSRKDEFNDEQSRFQRRSLEDDNSFKRRETFDGKQERYSNDVRNDLSRSSATGQHYYGNQMSSRGKPFENKSNNAGGRFRNLDDPYRSNGNQHDRYTNRNHHESDDQYRNRNHPASLNQYRNRNHELDDQYRCNSDQPHLSDQYRNRNHLESSNQHRNRNHYDSNNQYRNNSNQHDHNGSHRNQGSDRSLQNNRRGRFGPTSSQNYSRDNGVVVDPNVIECIPIGSHDYQNFRRTNSNGMVHTDTFRESFENRRYLNELDHHNESSKKNSSTYNIRRGKVSSANNQKSFSGSSRVTGPVVTIGVFDFFSANPNDNNSLENSNELQTKKFEECFDEQLVLRDRNGHSNSKSSNVELDEEVTSQRDKLTQILFKGTQECLVCCEKIKPIQAVWSCGKCFNILHLICTKKWASSSHTENGWRCPACQNVSTVVPEVYQCFCKKQELDTVWNHYDIPHSCGEVCNKSLYRGDIPCGHRCTLLCHPGPCPVCEIVSTRSCGCGKTSCQMQCGSTKTISCDSVCLKILNCLQHTCEDTCHDGPCQPCSKLVEQVCFCGNKTKSVVCSANIELNFSCESACNKKLTCENHFCTNACHPGPCDLCYLLPEFITTCCCGKTRLTPQQKRVSCLDPLPTCEKECGRALHCGGLNEKHKCNVQCHPSECPPCKLTSLVLCNCKRRRKEIQCIELKPDSVIKCNFKCTQMRGCGKHKCNQHCCTNSDHNVCPLMCNRKLRCGTHKCELLCHRGQCPPCSHVSFEELTCRCGSEVIFPPVACGTKLPTCSRMCTRSHPCDHTPVHTCHAEPECPPCVVFTEKWCFGHHQQRKNIFCYVQSFSCGQTCGKVLKCNRHTCNLPCHEGECLKATEKCKQLCSKPRPACGHACNEVCHPGSCPGSTCTVQIKICCDCGERTDTQQCIEDQSLLQQFKQSSKGEFKILPCDDTCAQIERNRRLALGLQIRNPDLTSKLKPLYPDLLKQWAKKDPDFCSYVHSKLADLVKLAKESKQKSRSFSFEVMNRDKRQFIHQYCDFFGVESVDCDPEPKRNVLVTAYKDKAWLPGYSLLETVHREKGQPKVPMVPLNKDAGNRSLKNEMVQLGVKRN